MSSEPFRMGITLGPTKGVYNIGITYGDWGEGCDFVRTISPLIEDFAERFKGAYESWARDRSVVRENEPRQ